MMNTLSQTLFIFKSWRIWRYEKIVLKRQLRMSLHWIMFVHVSEIHRNLVVSSLLSKNEFKLIFMSNKFLLAKNEMFVETCYLYEELLKINVMTIVTLILNEITSSTYLFELFLIWHEQLWHVILILCVN